METTKAAEERKKIINKKHPYRDANLLSKLFFTWSFPLFYQGLKRDINEDDLFPPLKAHSSKILGDKIEAEWAHELKTKKHPSLWRVLAKVFKYDFMLTGLNTFIIEVVIGLCQPLALSQLLQYYQPNSSTTKNEAYAYASIIVMASFFTSMVLHNNLVLIFQLGMKMRVACCALVYRKALKLSKSSLAETTLGQMVNLLANDVSRFDFAATFIHDLWVSPILLIIVMYLLPTFVGYTAVVGVGLLLSFIPLQMWMGKKTSVYRLKTAIRTDERIRLMNEIIMGIQVIKMYTWEKPFAKLVEISRKKEVQQILNNSIIKAMTLSFNLVLNRVAIYCCVLTYVLLGNTPTAQYVYVTTSFYGILKQTLTFYFPQAITSLAETGISIKRIRKFLMYEEVNNQHLSVDLKISTDEDKLADQTIFTTSTEIYMDNVSVKWIESSQDNSLKNISMVIHANEHVAIVGPVGSGKTTLLHLILKELSPIEGTLNVNGTVSYASQEPWLFAGTIQQNILFGQEFIPYKYQEVVRACALGRDFTLLPYGDRTIVGERGVTLSGGQKARINLARAIYKDADIYVLDDPLSAVDTHVGRHLFDKCISGYLQNKCVVLVTHQLQYLQNVDKIFILENGKVDACGQYRDLKDSGKSFTKLLASLEDEAQESVEKESKRRSSRKPSERPDEDATQPEPEQEKETTSTGEVSWKVYQTYLLAGGHWCKFLLLFLAFIASQFFGSGMDYFIAYWANLEQTREERKRLLNASDESANSSNSVEDEYGEFNVTDLNKQTCLIIYTIFMGLVVILTLSRSVIFYRFCMKVSKVLHNRMFKNIVYATMRFFNTNSSGRILNRFSKDMGYIDETLPMTIIDTIQIGLSVLAISLLVGSVNPWVLIPSGIMLAIFYVLRIVFVSYSRPVKRLEATTRSPIFSHLTASLQGLTTIRALGAQDILRHEFDNYQDAYSSAYFMFFSSNRAFAFWLDMQCVIYIGLVTLGFLFIGTETYGGNVGLAITQSITLTGMFQWGMRQWSEMENQMTSVERVKEYIDINPEIDTVKTKPPETWPSEGKIEFDDVCLRYDIEEPYVLNNLSFEINGGEKVGIVGRTGAGKSSLIFALFRLAEVEGTIKIDNINIRDVPLKNLRSNISIIPQEPVLFSGTLRKNLDPFDEFSDEVLWNALEEVELKKVVSDLPHGLESKMSEGGSNFSVGQRQLVCLARAISRNNKILVLDEATANVDPQTDALIQSTIREKFSSCTVLTIAHRLHTIMDSDKVLVMDAGRVAQFDHPYCLLKDVKGLFYSLVEQTGKTMAANLSTIAQESFIEN